MMNTDTTKWKVYALIDLNVWKEYKRKCDVRKIDDVIQNALIHQIQKED